MSAAGLSGCVIDDGGPDFTAHADVTNKCSDPVVLKVDATSQDNEFTPKESTPLQPSAEYQVLNAFFKPVPELVYLSVAAPKEADYGEPHPLSSRDLPVEVDADGVDVYEIDISGDLCPGGLSIACSERLLNDLVTVSGC